MADRTVTDPDKRGRHSTAIRFDPDVYERVAAEAEARTVSINWIVNRLVVEGLERIVPVEDMWLTRSPTDNGSDREVVR